MKKNIITSIILSAMVIGTSTAFATDCEPVLMAEPIIADDAIGTPQITVCGEKVDLSKTNLSQYIFTENGNTMVPLRAVAEKMGYSVEWNSEERAVTVGNDSWEIVLFIGLDSYVGVTKIKDAVGMTAPQSYGTAPMIIENRTFVPAKMFELMDYQYSTAGQFVNFEYISNSVQIPSPFISYENVDEAKKALNFEPTLPTFIPDEFNLDDISVMGNDFLQLSYKDEDNNRLSFRTAKRNEDISGDYNTYAINKEVRINDITVTLCGNDKIASAAWTDGECSFAVYSDKELDETVMIKLIAEVK